MDLSLRDAAKALDVSESTLARWVKEEGLPAFVINGRYRFNRVDLLEWASRRRLPAGRLFAPAGADAVPALADLLDGHVHHDVPGTDLASAMAAISERLPLPTARDRETAAQALARREAVGSTAIGDGIAIPHARSPLVFGLERPVLVLCFLKNRVVFGDGREPVDTVFVLLTPTVRLHLGLLSRIAAVLHDPDLRALLRRRATAAEILARLRALP